MLIVDKEIIKSLKTGDITPVELERHLLNNFSAPALAHELAQCLIEQQAMKPIVITQQQLETHFRIRGWKFTDGYWRAENRGHYAKKDE